MFPFARINQYGNTISPNWYSDPRTILAWDSTIFGADVTFSDYTGKNISIDRQGAGPNPSLNTGPASSYGPGVKLSGAGLMAAGSQIPSSTWSSSFTVDMWYAQTSTANVEFIPFGAYRTAAANDNKYLLWFYAVDGQGVRYQNNGTNTIRSQSLYPIFTSTWKHIAYVYDSTTHTNYFFVNGTLTDSFSYTVTTPTSAAFAGVGGHYNSPTSTIDSIVERFRIRTGAIWTSNFNTSTIYP